ncbi:uncharacterized protein [Mytilus edulis]|uniref:uncharacterized protein n=1 Tax=Mytilus edulis TaxID=6550 RepID=UPI0039EE87FF
METSVLYRCAGDIIYNDQEPVPGHISDVQLKMYSETSNFLQYLKPLTPQNPYFFGQIRSLSTKSKVTIGIAGPDIKDDAHPGNWNNTVGYHSDTGKCYTSHKEIANTYGEKFGIGDVFGVCVTYFGQQMSTVTFVKNGKPVATRYHFETDHSKFLPTITLENGPIDLGIMWPQAVFGSPQFDEKNMLHWMSDPSVNFDMSKSMFILDKAKDKIIATAPIQSPMPLCSGFSHFEVYIKETTDGAAASVGIGDCSPLKPSPTCEILRDFMTWTADGKVNKVEENDRVGMGVHYHPDSRDNPGYNDKESQLVLCFVTKNTVTIYAKMIIQPEGGFYPLVLLDQNCRKVSVDVESNRTIEVYDNLDRVFKEAVEEATKHIIEDCIKREIHIKMFRKSDALVLDVPKEPSTDIDLSKLYCRITLPAETMGIHAIQFCKPLTEDNSYFCLDIKTLNEDSVVTTGVADSNFDLSKHPGKTENTVGWMSQNGRMFYNTRYEGNVNGQRYEEGDTVGLDCSVFESSLPVVLFSKNYHPIGLRYLMANDPSQYFPTIALCGNGYEVVVDVFWHTRLCVGPTFEIDNVNYWIIPEGSKVNEKEKMVTIPEHTDAEVLQCPYPLSDEIKFNYFEIQIVDKFGSNADGIPPPGIALSSPCFQDISVTMSSNFRQDFIRFLAKGEAESSVSVGDTLGWGIIVPKSEQEKKENRLVICYLCINRNIALTRVSYEPPGGFYATVLLYPGVNRAKIGRIRYIHTHPITEDKIKILLKEAKDIIALEEAAKLEGNDALDVIEDKNSLFRQLPGIIDETDEKSNKQKMENVAFTANAIDKQKKKMKPGENESKACVIL